MNWIILIGNGFDLAHGLPTAYADFLNYYWEHRLDDLHRCNTDIHSDGLSTLQLEPHDLALNYGSTWNNFLSRYSMSNLYKSKKRVA